MLTLAGLGLLLASAAMALVWLAAYRWRNAGIVDVAWTLIFIPLAGLYAALGTGDPMRRTAVVVGVTAWSLRLGLHLGRRVAREHPREDGRYAALRQKWGAQAEPRMFAFFQLQGVTNVLLSTPFLLACRDPRSWGGAVDVAALVLLATAIAGEATADAQLARFKADPAVRGQVCRVGLWSWSRHPNYFFEWLAWCAWALLALPAPAGALGLIAPAVMLVFLLGVTGIPATEGQSVRSRGDAYRRYQQEVSAFIPRPPHNARQ